MDKRRVKKAIVARGSPDTVPERLQKIGVDENPWKT